MDTTEWVFPPVDTADENGVVGVGADLEPATLLAAYSRGLFPMPIDDGGLIAWWSPDPRAIIPVDGIHVSRSLQKSMRRFTYTMNSGFAEVIERCADPSRPHGWIDHNVRHAYTHLHELGWAHSLEARNDKGQIVGGVYGVGMAGFFAGESMFHDETDASKAALVTLVNVLRESGVQLFDVQWMTPHLRSLGAVEVARSEYLRRLETALRAAPVRTGYVEEAP